MYQRLEGRLIYLIITRPNISYVVNLVIQFMHALRTDHFAAVHRILRYLKGSKARNPIHVSRGCKVVAYTNVDWAGSLIDRKAHYRELYNGRRKSSLLEKQETGCQC